MRNSEVNRSYEGICKQRQEVQVCGGEEVLEGRRLKPWGGQMISGNVSLDT